MISEYSHAINKLYTEACDNPNGLVIVSARLIQEMVVSLRSRPQDVIEKLADEIKAERERAAKLKEKVEFYENVLKGEATHTMPCDHGTAFRIRVDVKYAVETDSETHVPDIDTLVDAKRYCRQMNIEDKFGDGRIDMCGMAGSDYGQFIEQNAKMLHDILIMAEETKAYLATLPEYE